jgi:hypothetical protein
MDGSGPSGAITFPISASMPGKNFSNYRRARRTVKGKASQLRRDWAVLATGTASVIFACELRRMLSRAASNAKIASV